jgi:FKBP-type peptidyl-prolyl cis-trans isomerase
MYPAREIMKSVFQIIAAAACAIVLTACGGGSGGGGTVVTPPAGVQPPTALKIEDTTVGTGAEAVTGKTASVRYTGYLYDGTKSDLRGVKFDSNVTSANPFSFVVNANPLSVISGFNSGVAGMKVGGKRVVTIPPAQGYGASGQGSIPANATLIFEIELVAVN